MLRKQLCCAAELIESIHAWLDRINAKNRCGTHACIYSILLTVYKVSVAFICKADMTTTISYKIHINATQKYEEIHKTATNYKYFSTHLSLQILVKYLTLPEYNFSKHIS